MLSRLHKDYLLSFCDSDTIGFFRTGYGDQSSIFIMKRMPTGAEESRFILTVDADDYKDMESGKLYQMEDLEK